MCHCFRIRHNCHLLLNTFSQNDMSYRGNMKKRRRLMKSQIPWHLVKVMRSWRPWVLKEKARPLCPCRDPTLRPVMTSCHDITPSRHWHDPLPCPWKPLLRKQPGLGILPECSIEIPDRVLLRWPIGVKLSVSRFPIRVTWLWCSAETRSKVARVIKKIKEVFWCICFYFYKGRWHLQDFTHFM